LPAPPQATHAHRLAPTARARDLEELARQGNAPVVPVAVGGSNCPPGLWAAMPASDR
jgi:hypothetical protein